MQILIRQGPGQGRAVALCQARLTVGRTGESDIALQGDWLVSRRHCEIVRRGSAWAVVDVGSKNGTLLNGHPIHAPTVLRHGDSIRVGSSELLFLTRPISEGAAPYLQTAGAALAAQPATWPWAAVVGLFFTLTSVLSAVCLLFR